MEQSKSKTRRCAVYTRKSSEEGLEQNFNSLHAQREACEAFIKSQASEGWKLVKTAYDDGGLSGGCAYSKLESEVLMMEPAKDWNRGDTADLLSPTKIWSIFLQ
jgi:hypothetical protein